MMLENFSMPAIIMGEKIKLVARNVHDYDEDSWFEINQNRLFLREYLLWVDKTNSLQDVCNTTDMFIDISIFTVLTIITTLLKSDIGWLKNIMATDI